MKHMFFILGLLMTINSFSQIKYKGGNISTEDDNETFSVKVNIELVTSLDSEIDSIEINFGDGSLEWAYAYEQIEYPDFNTLISKFTTNHHFPGFGHYAISIQDCCWSETGINTTELNNSEFVILREHTVVNPQFSSIGSSPISINSFNLIEAENQSVLIFTPQFFDSEGDSISIKLIPPIGDSLVQNNYLFPDEINPSPNNIFSINDLNQVIWATPQEIGEYHFGYELTEYRNGEELSKENGISMIIVNETTSTQEKLSVKELKIYPNPVSNEINIQIEDDVEYVIYNIQGQRILSGKGYSPKIQVKDFPKGTYTLSVFQEGKNSSTLIIKE
ncbi:MAG: T9SS type A sorting domain-containing protein [Saprospiraceae bacterium]